MNHADERAWLDAVDRVLGRSHLWRPDQMAETVTETMARLGIAATVYLVDAEQVALRALTSFGGDTPKPVPVDDSEPGRAFATVSPVAGDGRWWVPMVNGTDRLGVVDFVLPAGVDLQAPGLRQRCEMFAGLVGHLITTTEPRGDHLQLVRRSQPMSPASELLWQLLQPLTVSCDQLTVAAVLQPCYSVGGDGYDYAIDGPVGQVAILDAAGAGLRAGLATAVAISVMRATRRAGGGLQDQARAVDAALLEQFPDARFVTGFLAELHLETGLLRYLNAGHPAPLLLRHGADVAQVTGGGRMPLGIDDADVTIGEQRLEDGDRLLLYTDGVTEARDETGEQFGVNRLVELVQQHAAEKLPVAETLRRLSHAVIEHQHGPPADDATLLLAEWSSSVAHRSVP
ncbi:PP2C family protein-serine/threonine phosphatase [Actinoplanes sp. NPDC051633]|uniref:PP2C family protein-serine/threonine phosphatase n=1 Tax=Actinoplanes sp. NPDC051633 TaxID=3155670 RepID=UPI00343E8C11